jgi:hypothetical protein
MFVRPSLHNYAWYSASLTGQIFIKFRISVFFTKLYRHISILFETGQKYRVLYIKTYVCGKRPVYVSLFLVFIQRLIVFFVKYSLSPKKQFMIRYVRWLIFPSASIPASQRTQYIRLHGCC